MMSKIDKLPTYDILEIWDVVYWRDWDFPRESMIMSSLKTWRFHRYYLTRTQVRDGNWEPMYITQKIPLRKIEWIIYQ